MAEDPGPRRRRIVVVEDDDNTALIVRYNCEAAGYRVDCIADGAAAAAAIPLDPPDLVVLDWMLPGISGIELLRRLRGCVSTRHIPVVLVTARAEAVDRAYAMASGADEVLPKSITVGALMACISGLLSPDRRSGCSVGADRGAMA